MGDVTRHAPVACQAVYAPPMLLILLACGPKTLTLPESPADDSGVPESLADDSAADDSADDSAEDPCAARCDDGLDCTSDTCDAEDRCIHAPLEDCAWPAALPPEVLALASLDADFDRSLSGATWNPATRALWVVRGDGATAWRLVEDGGGGWIIEEKAALDDIDAESVTLADPVNAPNLIHVMIEHEERITAYDIAGSATRLRTWDTSTWLETAGTRGSEGLAFVPDEALAAWGFVDGDGAPRTSALGYGGLFFVGTQNGGEIHVFDLSATDESLDYVGAYGTARDDTSALEFDAGTGRLYIWHGGEENDLEIVRLSSTDDGGRRFDTELLLDYPGDANIEGLALEAVEDCADGARSLFLTIDDGRERALDVYVDWPICAL